MGFYLFVINLNINYFNWGFLKNIVEIFLWILYFIIEVLRNSVLFLKVLVRKWFKKCVYFLSLFCFF